MTTATTTLLSIQPLDEPARSFSFEALAALPGQIADVGAIVPGRQGGAVRLHALLAAAGVADGDRLLTLSATDGKFSADVPLQAVREALVIYRLGDGPLPGALGGPVRFLLPDADACDAPGVSACSNVKYLRTIRVKAG